MAVGVKFTDTAQFAPAARLAVQVVLDTAKSPLAAIAPSVTGTIVLLVRVTVLAPLVTLTA